MYHKLTIIGCLEDVPYVMYTDTGMAVCRLSVFTEHIGKQTITFHVFTTEGLAFFCAGRLAKDQAVLCEGYLDLEANGEPYLWQDEDSNSRKQYSLTAYKVVPLEVQAIHDYDVEVLEALNEENLQSQRADTLGQHPSDRFRY